MIAAIIQDIDKNRKLEITPWHHLQAANTQQYVKTAEKGLQINGGTTIISITTTTQAKHQKKKHCNKTNHNWMSGASTLRSCTVIHSMFDGGYEVCCLPRIFLMRLVCASALVCPARQWTVSEMSNDLLVTVWLVVRVLGAWGLRALHLINYLTWYAD